MHRRRALGRLAVVHPPRRPRRHALAWAAALLLAGTPPLHGLQAAGPAPSALPEGLSVVHGAAQVTSAIRNGAAQMTVRNSAGAILEWQRFDIGAAAGVHFQQPNAASKVLNRVTGSDPSAIFGALTSNGQVWLLNPNGVLFGAGARVDVAALVASTLRLGDNAFLDGLRSGRFEFGAGLDGATVRNDGDIVTARGGHLLLLADRVDNRGRLEAPGGSVTLAAAAGATLVDTALPRLAVRLPAGTVTNLSRIAADGGTVDVIAAAVNQQGLVRADTLALDAQGRVVLKAADTLTLAEGSVTQAAGGALDLLGERIALVGDALVDASGTAGGGHIRIGGGLRGQDTSVANAEAVWIGPEARVRADTGGPVGDGGSVIVWSDAATRAYGSFSARGGALGGDGGFVETSGGWIDAQPAKVDVAAPRGRAGTWLIDPNNLFVIDGASEANITGGPDFTTTGDSAVIATETIAAALNAGTSVSLVTAAVGGTEPGDIFFDDVNLIVTPPSPVTLTVKATRDILVNNSIIRVDTGGSALNLDFQAADNGVFGVIDIAGSSFFTAGGNVTLGGSFDRTLPLPDGSSTAASYRPALAYTVGTGGASLSRSSGQIAVDIADTVIDAGAGTVRLTGLGLFANQDTVRIADTGAPTEIRAATIELFGASDVIDRVGVDVGVMVRGGNTNLVATDTIRILGAGDTGVAVEAGARLALAGSGAGLVEITGYGDGSAGVELIADDIETGLPGRGSRITVAGGALQINGRAVGGAGALGVGMFNFAGAPGPLLDLTASAAASSVSGVAGGGFAAANVSTTGVDWVLPTGGSLAVQSDTAVLLNLQFISGGNAALSLAGSRVDIQDSTLLADTGPVDVQFASRGGAPEGVRLLNAIIETGGGDLTFGDLRTVSSTRLGDTTVPANWLELRTSLPGSALEIADSVIDAGTGAVRGGGAAGSLAFDGRGVEVFRSTLTAATIELAGRSDFLEGVVVDEGTLRATAVLSLDAASASNSPPSAYGLRVTPRSLLQLVDPTLAAGSAMTLAGLSLTDGVGVSLEGGPAGSGLETRIVVDGAALEVRGTSGSGTGLRLLGDGTASGGLLVDSAGAPSALFDGRVTLDAGSGGTGIGVIVADARIVGPQLTADAPLTISGNGGLPGQAGVDIRFANLSSGGVTTLAGNSVNVGDSLLSGDGDIRLYAVDAGAAAGGVLIENSRIQVENPGARIDAMRRDGTAVTGVADIASGAGVSVVDSELVALGAGGAVALRGDSAATGGPAGVFVDRSPVTADNVEFAGRGSFNADGVTVDDSSAVYAVLSTISALNLTVQGTGANDPAATTPDRVGVRFGLGSEVQLGIGGTAAISGDTVALGAPFSGRTFIVQGAPASFSATSTGSMFVGASVFDFTTGTGTTVSFTADGDSSGAGRLRLEDSFVSSAGGAITLAGTGEVVASVNASLSEGVVGLHLDNASLDAAGGAISLTGNGPPSAAGLAGVRFFGASSLTGGALTMSGSAGLEGFGIDIGAGVPGATVSLAVTSATLSGQGVGIDGATALPFAGVAVDGQLWSLGAGPLELLATDSPVDVSASTLDAPRVFVGADGTGGRVTLVSSSLRATAGDLAVAASAGIEVSATQLVAAGSGSRLTLGAPGPTSTIGTDGRAAGAGVSLVDSVLEAPDAAGVIDIRGQGAAGGGDGVFFVRTPLTAASITLVGAGGGTAGHGVISDDAATSTVSLVSATNLTIQGTAADDPAATELTRVGVLLGSAAELALGSGGAVSITGDLILLGRNLLGPAPATPFRASGAPATVDVVATRSIGVEAATLDFTGSAVLLRGDSDGIDGGRVRLSGGTVLNTAGGDVTIEGAGVAAAVRGEPLALIAREGASGVFLSGVNIDAGTGAVALVATSVDDPAADGGVVTALLTMAPNVITGGLVTLDATNLRGGYGASFNDSTGTTAITADTLLINGTGVGVDTVTGLPYEGVRFLPTGTTLTASGGVAVNAAAGGISAQNLTVSAGGDVGLDSPAGPVSVRQSGITAGATLTIDATHAAATPALSLVDGVSLSAGGAVLRGVNPGGAGLGVELLDDFGASSLSAASGPLTLDAGLTPGDGGVSITSWALSAGDVLTIRTPGAPVLAEGAGTSGLGGPTLAAGQVVIEHASDTAVRYGGAGVDLGFFNAAVAGNGAASTTRLAVVAGSGALELDGALAVPGRLELLADTVNLLAGASASAGATGDALVVASPALGHVAGFANAAGASALATPAGRWVILSEGPSTTALGGLVPALFEYDLGASPWGLDAGGDYLTPLAGSAVGYRLSAAAASGTALSGSVTRVYDATVDVTLDPGTWTITGLVPGEVLVLTGVSTATLADKTVGTDRPLALDPGSVFAVETAAGVPVFGYDAPTFTATITPLSISATGTLVAPKVYDATTLATLAEIGSVAPLAGDVVTLGGTITAAFSDKNVGTAKPVAASGFALLGADAGNYTLVPPTGLAGDITPAPLPVTGVTALGRVYDATAVATLAGTAAIAPLGADVVVLGGTPVASFADKNVGTAKPVSVSGYTIGGTDAPNYTLVQPTGLAADITPADLLVGGLTAVPRVYDRSTVVALSGAPTIAPLGADVVTVSGTPTGSLATPAAGSARAVSVGGLVLAGADAPNYTLVAPATLTVDVTPAPLTLAGVAATSRLYTGVADTTTTATGTLAGVIAGDVVTVALSASFADGNAGTAKAVVVTGALSGADAANYTLAAAAAVADIAPAPLVLAANPVLATVGSPPPLLTGSVSGFVGGDTLATATTGTLAWTSPGTTAVVPGSYAITGGGLTAANYTFVQAAANATAYTLRAAAVTDPVTTATRVITSTGLSAVTIPITMSTPTDGRTFDATPAFGSSLPGLPPPLALALAATGSEVATGLAFPPLDFSRLPRDEIQTLLAARARYKRQLFAKGIFALQQDPSLADVRPCTTEAEIDTGLCLITEQLKQLIQAARAAAEAERQRADATATTPAPPRRPQRRVIEAAVPAIERKLALLIGVNEYRDPVVPDLVGAVPDTRAVRERLEQRLGYETTVLENPTREQIVRAFNRLAVEARPEDSVIVYYAGHGVVVPVDGVDTGFWLPADVDSTQAQSWLSNADIARLIAAVGSRQLMLVSDSCYSGSLVGKDRGSVAGGTPDELLSRRAAVVMSSGGDEPVADEGRDGHSVFAWHFMRALEGLDQWQPGSNLYERVRAAVVRDFPQTPQYGGSRGLGHEGGTDYLFERRQIEAAAPVAPAPTGQSPAEPALPAVASTADAVAAR